MFAGMTGLGAGSLPAGSPGGSAARRPGVRLAATPLAVAEADLARLRDLHLPLEPLVAGTGPAGPVFRRDTLELPPEQVHLDLVGFLALGPEGRAALERVRGAWQARFGAPAPELLELDPGAEGARSAVLAWLAARLLDERDRLARRNVSLTRGMAELRRTHRETQEAFRTLESYVGDTARAPRQLAGSLEAGTPAPRLPLQDGDMLEQRLPVSSVGLSDVALLLAGPAPAGEGRLEAVLELAESGAVAAHWLLPARALQPGWLRLSLPVALGADPQTPLLRLSWSGAERLSVASGCRSADPRFRMQHNGAPRPEALAVKSWKALPGAAAVLPAEGHPAAGGRPEPRWMIGRSLLERAEPVATDPEAVRFSTELGGLLVCPGPEAAVAAARLPGACRAGVQRITGGAETKQAEGPAVEYALAVAPAGAAGPAGLPEFAPGWRSDWVRLQPAQWSELRLFLPEPLEARADLYLLTRRAAAAEGAGEGTAGPPPAACFFRLLSQG